jgi:hypothetical protein
VHLAATLKKLLTIWLLIILAVQIPASILNIKTHEVSILLDTEETGEKKAEVKFEKEYLHNSSSGKITGCADSKFAIYSCDPDTAPVLDRHTPPPDRTI